MIKITSQWLLTCILFAPISSFAQRVAFDSLIANTGSNKSIVWTPSTYQNGYGHRVYGMDAGGKTDLRFASRHNTATWTDIMTITSNGNVGIGTVNPTDKMEIAGSLGSMKFSNSGARIMFTRNSANYIDAATSGGYLIFTTDGSQERMRIDSNGNVGIGVTDPGTCKLAVEGTVGARRVKVVQTGWPDYVFQPDYQLPALGEVAQYIKTNQHLQDIPSAAAIEKDGLDLGEMNKKLLQKVEELTLYLIRENKDKDLLQQQLTLLSSKVAQLEAAMEKH